jgi:hypothetical protein
MVYGNTADLTGGGIEAVAENGYIVILNNTVADNAVTDAVEGAGGGISTSVSNDAGSAELINNIARGNTVAAGFGGSCEDVVFVSDGDGNNRYASAVFAYNDAQTVN